MASTNLLRTFGNSIIGKHLTPSSSTSGAAICVSLAVNCQQTRGPRWWPQPQNEMSRHRTRPPTPGLHRLSHVNVVDNSALAKQALLHYKLPFIINVFRNDWRRDHMPHAGLGDKVTVVVKGEVRRAVVVGYNAHESLRKHGVANADINNVVLVDKDGNPLGTRILAPIPAALRHKRNDPTIAKILAIATKFV